MKKLSVPVGILVFGGAGVLCLWSGYALIDLAHSVEKWGVFGDKFGALNCLFTGLAMVGVVAALWHEREQAAERDSEHRAVLQRMDEQVTAMRDQTAMIVTAGRVDVLSRRISRLEQFLDEEAAESARTGMISMEKHRLGLEIKRLEDELDRMLSLVPGSKEPVAPQSDP